MGFQRSWFEGVATSGDVAHRVLSLPPGTCDPKLLPEDHPLWSDINPFKNENENEVKTQDTSINRHRRPRRCLHFTWKEFDLENGIDLTSLDIEPVTCPSQADFILVHWFDCIAMEGNKELQKVDETQVNTLLKLCAERQLPMLVANPDIVACKGEKLLPMPGSLAVKYEEM